MTLPHDRELLSAEEVAAYLDVQPVTIYRWCREGRLPCLKLGKAWRIRRTALEAFLQQRERGTTLVGQLRGFLAIPDQVIAIAETREEMHRLDAAFFQVGEVRDGRLTKYFQGESLAELREALTRHGLDVQRLEREGRLRFVAEDSVQAGRTAMVRELLAAQSAESQPLWIAFNWAEQIDLDTALAQQEEVATLSGQAQVVVLTQVLEKVVDEWPPATRRRLRALHTSSIELSANGLVLSRRTMPQS
ncbi:MAG: helix-turn-helix domain-containing protein [Chloroflexia bacterium]